MTWQAPTRLRMADANAALDAGRAAISAGESRIDLAAATDVDSSAVALLLAWRRSAASAGRPLSLDNAGLALVELVRLYGVEDLVDLRDAATP